jgi:hypothetical protein
MNTNPLTKGIVSENFKGIGTVSDEMVEKRAIELALINGRAAKDVSETDYAQAKRELTGGSDIEPEEEALDLLPQTEPGDPLPDSTGHQVPNSIEDDEDGEGRSIGEQLVSSGLNEAEHDQMLQAARDAEKNDPTETTDQ